MNPNVNYKLWVIMMCQCWLISSNKCTTFRQDFDSRGSCANVGAGSICAISVPYTQFCCRSKSALKIKFIFFTKIILKDSRGKLQNRKTYL